MKGIAVPSFMIIGYVWQILGKRARPILSRVKASFSLNHYLYQKSMKVFLQLFLVILLPVFFRYISEILCPYIPPCLSDKCGFCKFYEVHSFMKLTRYLLKNINTWFQKSDIVLIVYLFIFICFNDGVWGREAGRWKDLLVHVLVVYVFVLSSYFYVFVDLLLYTINFLNVLFLNAQSYKLEKECQMILYVFQKYPQNFTFQPFHIPLPS